MGGRNSSRWGDYEPRPRVESAPVVLGITQLGHLEPGTSGTLKWGESRAVAQFIVQQEADHRIVALKLRVAWSDPEPVDQVIHLVPLPMPQGGVRWVARCPVCQERRAVKLYVPPDGGELMCRTCAGLLYKSSQRSDPRISALRADPVALTNTLVAPKSISWTWVALTAHWKEEKRILRWLKGRDPVKKLLALAELDPEFVGEVLREEVGPTPQ